MNTPRIELRSLEFGPRADKPNSAKFTEGLVHRLMSHWGAMAEGRRLRGALTKGFFRISGESRLDEALLSVHCPLDFEKRSIFMLLSSRRRANTTSSPPKRCAYTSSAFGPATGSASPAIAASIWLAETRTSTATQSARNRTS